jgi:hypothetical protein
MVEARSCDPITPHRGLVMTEPLRPMNRAGGQPPVERVYEGPTDEACKVAMDNESSVFSGMQPRVLARERVDLRFRPDISRWRVVWEAPPFAGPGTRLVGTQPEVVWSTPAEAKFAIKELRLVKKTMTAHKREASGGRTAARKMGDAAGVANFDYQVSAWERGILSVDSVIRDLEGWLLYNPR